MYVCRTFIPLKWSECFTFHFCPLWPKLPIIQIPKSNLTYKKYNKSSATCDQMPMKVKLLKHLPLPSWGSDAKYSKPFLGQQLNDQAPFTNPSKKLSPLRLDYWLTNDRFVAWLTKTDPSWSRTAAPSSPQAQTTTESGLRVGPRTCSGFETVSSLDLAPRWLTSITISWEMSS